MGNETADIKKSEITDVEEQVRSTAPQSPYTMRDVGVGFGILVVGMVIVYGIPAILL